MNVPLWLWFSTVAGILVLLAADLLIVDRNPHAIRVGEAARWVVFYVACAILFGLGILAFYGGTYAGEFFAGYITEYSLSVDNLFIFVIIMTTFGVPAIYQHKVLLFGILTAMVLRGLFIAAGAAVIQQFQWVFYLFGAFLLYTGWRLAFGGETDEEAEFTENSVLRLVRRFLPVTEEYHGPAVFARIDGKRFVTPMLVVMLAIGTTDILFALDSIPAIFGLTKEPFLVFSSNAFALLGLRQLYFLLGGLLNRLVYLDRGLAVILGFIGLKLISEALHGQGVSWAPEIGIVASLAVIVLVLGVTTVLSLLKVRRDPSAAKQLPTRRPDAPDRRAAPAAADAAAAEITAPADPLLSPTPDSVVPPEPTGSEPGPAVSQPGPTVSQPGPTVSRPSEQDAGQHDRSAVHPADPSRAAGDGPARRGAAGRPPARRHAAGG